MSKTIKPDDEFGTIEFTGERFEPVVMNKLDAEIVVEHLHRYEIASTYAEGKMVLDLACGSGYGTDLLAQKATKVYGMDIDHNTIENAKSNYPRDNIEFIIADCRDVPLDDNSIDLVVSFETVEHLIHQKEMLSEFKRVLKPDGLLLISSPDKKEYSDSRNYVNEFHVKELYEKEFEELIGGYFKHHMMFGQRVVFGSLLSPHNPDSFGHFHHATGAPRTLNSHLVRPMYHVALCSNSPLPTVPRMVSLYEETASKSYDARKHENDYRILTEQYLLGKEETEKLKDTYLNLENNYNNLKLLLEQDSTCSLNRIEELLEAIRVDSEKYSDIRDFATDSLSTLQSSIATNLNSTKAELENGLVGVGHSIEKTIVENYSAGLQELGGFREKLQNNIGDLNKKVSALFIDFTQFTERFFASSSISSEHFKAQIERVFDTLTDLSSSQSDKFERVHACLSDIFVEEQNQQQSLAHIVDSSKSVEQLLASQSTQVGHISEAIHSLTSKLEDNNAVSEDYRSLTKSLAEKNQELIDAKNELLKSQHTISDLEGKLHAGEMTLTKLASSLSETENSIQYLQKSEASLTNELSKSIEQCEGLTNTSARLTAQLQEKTDSLLSEQKRIAELNAENERLVCQNQQFADEKHTLQESESKLKAENEQQLVLLEKLKDENSALLGGRDKIKQSYDKVLSTLENDSRKVLRLMLSKDFKQAVLELLNEIENELNGKS